MGIFCIGDIHGKFDQLVERLREIPPKSHILCAGDIGVGFEDSADPECMDHVNAVAQELEVFLWMIRGNHDNPYCFRGQQQVWNNAHSNIKLMADVDSIELEGHHVMFVGGAISVDRSHEGRIDGYSWWKEEPVHESCPSRVYHLVEEFGPADLLITHAGPITALPVIDEFDPNVFHYSATDPTLLHDINEERTRLSDCVHHSRAPVVVYGHYHVPLEYNNTGVDYRCVAELEVWEFQSKKTAHLPKAKISEEEKAKVETAPIRLKAPLKAMPEPDAAVASYNTEDATTDELIAKTEHLRSTSRQTLVADSSAAKRLPPIDNAVSEEKKEKRKQLPPL
jgi:predicted phosphodiesterase